MSAGRWKTVENSIEEVRPDGTPFVRFRTVPASETPAAMDELHERFERASRSGEYHPLLLAGCYVFDFLAIHPFRDGNGRIGRLLTLLLLYQAGYEVGRFISLERLVQETSETYYEALQTAGIGWHTDEHDVRPWLNYLLGMSPRRTRSSSHASASSPGAALSARQSGSSSASRPRMSSPSPTSAAQPAASQSYISKTLAKMRDGGLIEATGTGTSARWRRLRRDF